MNRHKERWLRTLHASSVCVRSVEKLVVWPALHVRPSQGAPMPIQRRQAAGVEAMESSMTHATTCNFAAVDRLSVSHYQSLGSPACLPACLGWCEHLASLGQGLLSKESSASTSRVTSCTEQASLPPSRSRRRAPSAAMTKKE